MSNLWRVFSKSYRSGGLRAGGNRPAGPGSRSAGSTLGHLSGSAEVASPTQVDPDILRNIRASEIAWEGPWR